MREKCDSPGVVTKENKKKLISRKYTDEEIRVSRKNKGMKKAENSSKTLQV